MIVEKIKDKLKDYEGGQFQSELIVATTNNFNIRSDKKYDLIINLEITNNIRRINKFHETVNLNLINSGYYVSCCETLSERKVRNRKKIPLGFKNLFLIIDFIYKRVVPKLPVLKVIYFAVSDGRNRVMSEYEMLGRLISCGFEIKESFEYDNLLYIISRRKKGPDYNLQASYGPLFKMKRIGKSGKIGRASCRERV